LKKADYGRLDDDMKHQVAKSPLRYMAGYHEPPLRHRGRDRDGYAPFYQMVMLTYNKLTTPSRASPASGQYEEALIASAERWPGCSASVQSWSREAQ
jgi:hypothetical protein